MARPMILIQEEKLAELYDDYTRGVPYSKLIKKHKLPMSTPTLSKLIGYYKAYTDSGGDIKTTIYANLFPEWLVGETIVYQPSDWIFRGSMPLGRWEHNDITAVH